MPGPHPLTGETVWWMKLGLLPECGKHQWDCKINHFEYSQVGEDNNSQEPLPCQFALSTWLCKATLRRGDNFWTLLRLIVLVVSRVISLMKDQGESFSKRGQ